MNRLLRTIFLFLLATGVAAAQSPFLIASGATSDALSPFGISSDSVSLPVSAMMPPADRTVPELAAPVTLPRMAPELALQTYQRRATLQSAGLVSYDATTLIRAALPDTSQYGEFELQRHYAAPRTLQFKAVHFSGDSFVKSNIITRLLQSEVDHVQKDDTALTALSPANYKFSFKGTSEIEGRTVHIYQVKPHKKRAGLFKGRVYLDAHTGSLVRAEGSVVKSPSFFIKKLEFVQDYEDIAGFTFPVHIHSEASARIVGRAVVDIYQSNYQPVTHTTEATQSLPSM
ncbi:MAG: hypothetical protein LAN83_18880 [Acidobacteriia bacterium]|nr:hypothetical protein [Terriglobia bacterium]